MNSSQIIIRVVRLVIFFPFFILLLPIVLLLVLIFNPDDLGEVLLAWIRMLWTEESV